MYERMGWSDELGGRKCILIPEQPPRSRRVGQAHTTVRLVPGGYCHPSCIRNATPPCVLLRCPAVPSSSH